MIVAARPSVGKTTLSINIARKVACKPVERQPPGVGIFSLEMPKEQVSKNLLCAEAKIASEMMRTYSFEDQDYEVVKEAARQLSQAPIFIDDTPGISPGQLRSRARRLVHRENVKLLVIDYLQLMQTDRRSEHREQAVAELSRQVKQVARELNVPIILLSQLRRPPAEERNPKPRLTDLRESGSIEQDADVVIMLHRELDENNVMTRDVTAIVQKNRNGATGDVRLSFFPEQFRFETYVPEYEEARSVMGV
ncbi:MAG: DnaB-like helicase C-terminal domain-containing protein [Planctomycetota bacterium]|nr:DnaB-like helicase C-terminal domain-containing protein [Planctomycetota bacterium]